MNEPLDEIYFNWLCAKVRQNPAPDYLGLLRVLHSTEFVWVEPLDENRAEDGKELREYFCNSMGIDGSIEWLDDEPCSLLEFFIAFSDRAEFQTDRPLKEWFWEFMTNLNLEDFRRVSRSDESRIRDILDTFVWRLYDYNGDGGIFPLRRPRQDQRKVEIWYQFFDYLEDQGLV